MLWTGLKTFRSKGQFTFLGSLFKENNWFLIPRRLNTGETE